MGVFSKSEKKPEAAQSEERASAPQSQGKGNFKNAFLDKVKSAYSNKDPKPQPVKLSGAERAKLALADKK